VKVAVAIIQVAYGQPHDRFSRTMFVALSIKKGEQIVGHRTVHESLAFPETQRSSNLWSHWKKKARKQHCVCTTS